MKRSGNLFNEMCGFQNLYIAFKKAFKGSGRSGEACKFYFNLERELIQLKNEIEEGTYRPGLYRYFKIYDPKERLISVAPFRDRVVHHAVVNVLEPMFEKIFIYDSYATRKGKGTHRAVERVQKFMKKASFYLKSDINKYFYNVDHNVLLNLIERKIKDKKLISLIKVIIENSDVSKGEFTGKGLPIGNLTSQFFANVYLDPFDHFIKEKMGVRHYIRYMDDFVIFLNDKEYLKKIRHEVKNFLYESLKLTLKDSATYINTRSNGLTFLGYRLFPALIRIKSDGIKRMKKKIAQRTREFEGGLINEDRFVMSITSLIGYACYADTLQLRKDIFTKSATHFKSDLHLGRGRKAALTG